MGWFLRALLGLFLRHGLNALGIMLVNGGLISAEEWQRVASVVGIMVGGCDAEEQAAQLCAQTLEWWLGAIAVLVAAAWSIYRSWRAQQQQQTPPPPQ